MESNLSLDEIVVYNNDIYQIVQIATFNWFLPESPIVYKLKYLKSSKENYIFVREAAIRKANFEEIKVWRLLYDNIIT